MFEEFMQNLEKKRICMQYNQVNLKKPPFCTYRRAPEVLSSTSPLLG